MSASVGTEAWVAEDLPEADSVSRLALGNVRLCLLLAQSGHSDTLNQCPLSEVKRTLVGGAGMSAFDPKRTLAAWDCCCANCFLNPISPEADPCCNQHHWGRIASKFQALSIRWF